MEKGYEKLIDRLIEELLFERLYYHGLAEKRIFLKSTCQYYFVHINAAFNPITYERVPGKVQVVISANMSDDYYEDVPVLVTDSFDEIKNIIDGINKNPRLLVGYFYEEQTRSTTKKRKSLESAAVKIDRAAQIERDLDDVLNNRDLSDEEKRRQTKNLKQKRSRLLKKGVK